MPRRARTRVAPHRRPVLLRRLLVVGALAAVGSGAAVIGVAAEPGPDPVTVRTVSVTLADPDRLEVDPDAPLVVELTEALDARRELVAAEPPPPSPEPAPESEASESAPAAYDDVWDRLARCESGGNWSINTGNGYYGGLQFSLSSWRMVGGSGYPHEASKERQIELAERLLDMQGWEAWPACSRQLGLR